MIPQPLIPNRSGSSSRREGRRRFRRRDLPLLLVIITVVMLAGLRWVGLPPVIRDTVLRRWNRDRRYVVQIDAIRFRFPFGVYLDRVHLYRRGAIGPPLLEAERVALRMYPGPWRHGRSGIRDIVIENGVIRRIPRAPDAPVYPIPWRLPDGEYCQVEFRNIDLTGLKIARGTVTCRVDGDRLWLDEGLVILEPDETAGKLRVEGYLHLPQRRYSGTVAGTFNPSHLIPVAEAWSVQAYHWLERLALNHDLPETKLKVGGVVGPPQHTFASDITVRGTDFRYRDIPIVALVGEGVYRYDERQSRLDVRRVVGRTEHGSIMGRLDCDFRGGRVGLDFTGATAPVIPADLAGVSVPERLREFQFAGDTQWKIRGMVSYRGEGTTDLRMQCLGEQVAFRDLGAGRVDLEARYHDGIFDIHGIQAAIFDGAVHGGMAIETPTEDETPTVRFELMLDRLDFRKLITAAIPESNPAFYEGLFSMNIKGTGKVTTNWPSFLEAAGQMRIREGRLFRLPLFGGLSQIMSRLIPGLDVVLMQTRANADFAIGGNRLDIADGRIQGEVFHVEGHGVYTFGEALNFQVQLKLMRDSTLLGSAVRTLTFPLSKLFEFRLSGTLDKPRWYPINFSGDLLRRIRDLLD